MPICIECRYPVPTLYTTYSKADDKALGKGVRLTQCPRCKRFADKYVEHDFVVLFIDLVLIKPQVGCYVVMRHNDCRLTARIGRSIDISCSTTGAGKMRNSMYVQQLSLFSWIREQYTEYSKPSITRFGILLLLFDVYLTWARIEKATPSHSPSPPLSLSQGSRARGRRGTEAVSAAWRGNSMDLSTMTSSSRERMWRYSASFRQRTKDLMGKGLAEVAAREVEKGSGKVWLFRCGPRLGRRRRGEGGCQSGLLRACCIQYTVL